MIRMIQASNAGHAKAYFKQALSKADYYINDQELNGQIRGKLAERLGITGVATKETFYALCDNTNPANGQQLTPRTKDERRVGYDINFHCPKSVSILHALSDDGHVMKAFEQSVHATMLDIEADCKARVRKHGQFTDRHTGEMIWADFVHQTARPVEGHLPDPHLHGHFFVFNATWDDVEQQIKAGEFGEIKRDMPYYQARFHKYLSDNLIDQGYRIRRTEKSFEVENVPERVIDLFSKRTDEIGRIAKEKGITDIDELGELGARTRSKKQQGVGMEELKADWRRQIRELGPEQDGKGERIIRNAPEKQPALVNARDCVDHALQHSFERASVIHDRRLLETAYRQSIGHRTISLGQITDNLNTDQRLMSITDRGQEMVTTHEVLAEEQRMVKLARSGQGKLRPLYTQNPEVKLKGQQGDAIKHILTTTDRISVVRGVAGAGKTTLMREAVSHIEATGKKVMVVAPSSDASRGTLKDEGFKDAETVARLLVDKKMQEKIQGQVLWVDEAGLLGTKDMTALLNLVSKENARLVLGGDTRQHSSVVRGDALRILNTVGEIKTAEVSKIYRQRNEGYRKAVENLSVGDVKSAFEKLEAFGAIKTIDPMKPNQQLIDDYLAAIKNKKSALVISPTHQQADNATTDIRERLRDAGMLGKKEITIERMVSKNLTEAQKADWQNINEGNIIQFNQNVPGIKRGSRWDVTYSSDDQVIIKNQLGEKQALPTSKSSFYDVYRRKQLDLSRGDRVRITRESFDKNDKRLNNGQHLQVASVKKDGQIELLSADNKTKYKIGTEFGHISHAYCITSHASQGKTVDEVFISQPAATFPATSSKQFYVSVSRGRDKVHIYTDDKEELLAHAQRLGDRQSALELMQKRKNIQAAAEQIARERPVPKKDKAPAKTINPKQRTIDIDYEPGI